jgi:hypothetical protein
LQRLPGYLDLARIDSHADNDEMVDAALDDRAMCSACSGG